MHNREDKMYEKFKKLIYDLFQFDSSELDFGIYRILKYKREQVKKFIEEKLPSIIEKEFKKYETETLDRLYKELEEIKENAKKLGIRPEDTPKYRELQERIREYKKIENIKNQVYNDLYNFFSRYYKEGDFIPLHRYSLKKHKYAIPYNGEEVKLYWANHDQYYIKTGLLFRDYTFECLNKSYKVTFRIVEAKETLNTNKTTKHKYFILSSENPLKFDKNKKNLIIKFEYRELTDDEKKKFDIPEKESQNKIQKEILVPWMLNYIFEKIPDKTLKEGLSKEKKNGKPILEYHLLRYIAKNTKDYFIHKNLKKFLSEQFDYFLKAEVLNLDDILKSKHYDKHLTRAKVVRKVGEEIIDFLASIEEFQKKLWEKKKFVIKTEYVITLDRIPEEFIDEILKNKKQLREWKELGFGEIKSRKDLIDENDKAGKKYKRLPVDTKYFPQEFKEKLLEKLTEKANLDDDLIDGILIKSENWQALNLLLNKYKNRVQTIYIDPPFNTGEDEFLYIDRYRHSCWYTMMDNRLELAQKLLRSDGNIFISIDENEKWGLKIIASRFFEFFKELIWESGAPLRFKATTTIWPRIHETILHFRRSENSLYFPTYTLKKWKTGEPVLTGSLIKIEDHKIYSNDFAIGARENTGFGTGQKPEKLIKLLFDASINYNAKRKPIVLDFFLGSGTTTAVAQKLNIKWIGIEINDMYFGELFTHRDRYGHILKGIGCLGRMKLVLYGKGGVRTEPTMLSKEIGWQGGGFFKYHYIEQYEDSLDNIEFLREKEGEKLSELFEGYIKYMLDYETQGSACLLNIDKMKDPFNYKLKVNIKEVGEPKEEIVDLIETFNYLLGIKVNKYKFRKFNGRKYVFVFGEKDNKKIVIVWRNVKGFKKEDYEKDRENILKTIKDEEFDIIYHNDQSYLEKEIDGKNVEIRIIEDEFKNLMFEKIS